MEECKICESDSSVSLRNGILGDEYYCCSCDYSWNKEQNCQCGSCDDIAHKSDCAVHNEPAEPNGECNCL